MFIWLIGSRNRLLLGGPASTGSQCSERASLSTCLLASVLRAALAGLGLLLQPRALVADVSDRGARVSLLPGYPVPARPLHRRYAADRRVTPEVRIV